MASHPTYDPNLLTEVWDELVSDPETPLIDRAVQGRYLPGSVLDPFLLVSAIEKGELVSDLSEEEILTLMQDLDLFQVPSFDPASIESLVSTESVNPGESSLGLGDNLVSPLQMAIAASSLGGNGAIPTPRLATAVNLPDSGWTILQAVHEPDQVFSSKASTSVSESLQVEGFPIWETIARVPAENGGSITWYLAGTLSDWNGAPLALAVLLEEDDSVQAQAIGSAMLRAALQIDR
jgi:cell division protein FtsI/penicillin-binding protein 2